MARWLGIDLSEGALRGAVIRSALRKLEIERYVEIPIAGPTDGPARALELTEAARNLLAAVGHAPDGIVASIGGEDASLRVIELPTAARKRIGEVLPFELEALLPYDPHDAVIDHQPIADDPSGLRLMVAAVLRSKVLAELERLRELGLEPRELAAGAAALDGLVDVAPSIGADRTVLLVELGDHRIDLCVLASGRCTTARTLGLGMLDMPGAAGEARSELQRALSAFRAAGLPAQVTMYYCGSGATGQGVQAWLSDVLGQDVAPLELPAASTGRSAPAPTFARALALAGRAASGRRRIDLRKGDLAPTAIKGQLASHVNLAVTCTVVAVMTAMFALKARQSLLVSEEEALTAQLAAVTKEVLGEEIDDAMLVQARVKSPKSSDPLPRFDAFDALAALSEAVPEEVSHEVRRVRIDIADEKAEGRFELQGSLESLGQRDDVAGALEQHPCFKDIQKGRTGQSGAAQGERVSYQLEAKLHCPGDVGGEGKKGKSKSEDALE